MTPILTKFFLKALYEDVCKNSAILCFREHYIFHSDKFQSRQSRSQVTLLEDEIWENIQLSLP